MEKRNELIINGHKLKAIQTDKCECLECVLFKSSIDNCFSLCNAFSIVFETGYCIFKGEPLTKKDFKQE